MYTASLVQLFGQLSIANIYTASLVQLFGQLSIANMYTASLVQLFGQLSITYKRRKASIQFKMINRGIKRVPGRHYSLIIYGKSVSKNITLIKK